MYQEEVRKLQEIIDDSRRIVFSEGPASPRRAGYRTSGAQRAFTISTTNTRRSRW